MRAAGSSLFKQASVFNSLSHPVSDLAHHADFFSRPRTGPFWVFKPKCADHLATNLQGRDEARSVSDLI
jgi:hypothetical protein